MKTVLNNPKHEATSTKPTDQIDLIRKSVGAPSIPDELTKTYGPNDDPAFRTMRFISMFGIGKR